MRSASATASTARRRRSVHPVHPGTSLSDSGGSPLLRVRVSRELDETVRKAAQDAGASRSQWVRQVLDDALHRAGAG